MSDYPYYGQNYGNRDQTNPPPYLPQTYPTPTSYYQQDDGRSGQNSMNQGYDNTMSAYGYNQQLPYSAPAAQTNITPIQSYQGWNQDSTGMSQYNANPQNIQSYGAYNQQNYGQNSQYYAPPVAVPHTQQQSYHAQTPVMPYAGDRDMSEGEFDDGSAHMNNPAVGACASGGATTASHYRGSDGNGYLDTAHRAVYSQSQNSTPQQPPNLRSANDYYTSSSSQGRRHPSGSYSPYVTQTEPILDQPSHNARKQGSVPSKQVPNKNKTAHQVEAGAASRRNSKDAPKPAPVVREVSPSSKALPRDAPGKLVHAQEASTHDAVTFKTVGEARKKAESAVLNLWSFDVRYPAYIEEGVDEKLVGELFDELGLSRAPSKSVTNGAIPQQSPTASIHTVPVPTDTTSNSQVASQSVPATDKGKQAVTNGAIPPITPTTPAVKTAAAAEKEKIMQMKMEALRKSREERAQKNAASKTLPSVKIPSPIAQSKAAVVAPLDEPRTSVFVSVSPTAKFTDNSTIDKNEINTVDKIATGVSTNFQVPNLTVAELPKPEVQPIEVQAVSQPKIPGLFLASNAATAVPAPSPMPQPAIPSAILNGQRKRPVAADFDQPAASLPIYKRPFGQSRNEQQPFVIDVSDDDDESDEDVAMDLESRADTESPVQAARKLSDQRIIPLASNNVPQKHFTPPPASSASTPTLTSRTLASQSANNKADPNHLRKKESEIEQLKRKIAEAEQRKKAKRTPTGLQTPTKSSTNLAAAANNVGDTSIKVQSSSVMQKAISTTENIIAAEQQKLAAAQEAEKKHLAEVQRRAEQSKRDRLERIANAIPRVDAEALQNQMKLEQLRAETAKVEAAIKKNLQDKQKLAEEMERLSREAEHQIQEQKEKLDSLTREESGSRSSATAPSRPASTQPTIEPAVLQPALEIPQPIGEVKTQQAMEEREKSPSVPMDLDDQEEDIVEESAQGPKETTPAANSPSMAVVESVQSGATVPGPIGETLTEGRDSENVDHVLEAALQEAVRADADSPATSDIEKEDNTLDATVEADKQSGSPEYSPVLERAQNSDATQLAGRLPAPALSEGESDNYEPPEATPPVEEPSQPDSPPFSPAPPDLASDKSDEMDFAEISNGHSDDNELNAHIFEEALPQANGSVPQLTEAPNSDNLSSNFFTAYDSPLKRFHAFRFHPGFKEHVSGGLKSMTYTHRIDPNKELCRYELMGGICNDHSCDLQHFREMGLPDDAVLTTLGSPDEFHGIQREKFIEGLKEVLSGLRARKIKDFDVIASEIVAHRSKFLGDPSKILMLEGTTI